MTGSGQVVDGIITVLAEKLAPDFDNLDLKLRIGDKLTPYLVVLIQASPTASHTHTHTHTHTGQPSPPPPQPLTPYLVVLIQVSPPTAAQT